MKTIRQQAIQTIKDMDYSDLEALVVKSHDTNSHKWMEVTPGGKVRQAEEADNNSAHYINYPDKEVASIFNINDESCEACGCDICTMYRHAEDGKEAFIEDYGYTEDEWDYCNETSHDDAIVEYELINGGLDGESIREQMIEAIENIEHGYFDDEQTLQWKNFSYEEKELNVRQIDETYQFARDYENAEVAAYNVRVAYENDPEWFGFDVDNLDGFEEDIKNFVNKLYFENE